MIRKIKDYSLIGFFWLTGLFILLVLIGIISYIFAKGAPFVSMEFLLGTPKGLPLGSKGGIYPAIKGTLLLISLALVIATIPALLTAIYLSEYGREGKLASIINVFIQSMAGIPSIVVGLFVYALGVVYLGWGISLIAGSVALAIMIMPVITVSSREALLAVSDNYRLIATSLGVSKSYAFLRVILPQAVPGILAGILLAMGYAAGATAPIMVTGAALIASSSGALLEPVMALPYHLYILVNEHLSLNMAYATALVLVGLLLILNFLALGLKSLQERINSQ